MSIILLCLTVNANVKASEFFHLVKEMKNSLTIKCKLGFIDRPSLLSNKDFLKTNDFIVYDNSEPVIIIESTPTAPVLSCKSKSNTSIHLNWTASSDDVVITGYNIYIDGVLKATLGNVLKYKIKGLIAKTQYKITVKAFNQLGNESTTSNTLTITTDSVKSQKYINKSAK